MDIQFTWVKDTGQYANGSFLYIKKVRVGYIGWDACRTKGSDIPPYRVSNKFDLKMKVTHFEKEEQGKEYLEKFISGLLKYLTEGETK